ncbi:23S rRNA pseudouridine(1911/1915/1917) synthase RluD [Oceanimonas baumannii]|uniref:Pseudouridine synthase n=1 Tax=Oceanimonas baumannii TaxID=129578 RepID=A0A235CJM3_9GAMM|nr:23S rRNA pseudouridine(1911/1915/1917) synthase RluD [Oceanimonas baumannii]OYD24753.1 23S rRNA pseudouridine(1911/1915/1917) synthase [Oceanimonas baumannii]TDW59505.1 23S rRNA pseudouridine1911/1915/1917 synthase [Oceanimonas baumannii]
MSQHIELNGVVADHQYGQRLDQALAEMFPDYSRSRIKTWIQQELVQIDGAVVSKPREKVLPGQQVVVTAELADEVRFEPQAIELNIVYEDDDILVINKLAGLVVHPGAGTPDGTLLNALLHHCPEIAEVPRAGIVHRLDKDTTGLMVVAKTIPAQTHLVTALQARHITREYEAVAIGHMTAGGTVDANIGRHPTQRIQMAVVPSGKPAVTHYRVMEKFRAHTRLRVRLETGRTHQIRVHMAYLKHPLVGDPVYGGRLKPPRAAEPELMDFLRSFKRQALHAVMLRLEHPISGELMEWHAPIPDDMVKLVEVLRADTEAHPDDLVWI